MYKRIKVFHCKIKPCSLALRSMLFVIDKICYQIVKNVEDDFSIGVDFDTITVALLSFINVRFSKLRIKVNRLQRA